MTQRRDLQALIDAAPVGKMQWRVIICCFLVVMLDGFDTAAIGFIAPDIRAAKRCTTPARSCQRSLPQRQKINKIKFQPDQENHND